MHFSDENIYKQISDILYIFIAEFVHDLGGSLENLDSRALNSVDEILYHLESMNICFFQMRGIHVRDKFLYVSAVNDTKQCLNCVSVVPIFLHHVYAILEFRDYPIVNSTFFQAID